VSEANQNLKIAEINPDLAECSCMHIRSSACVTGFITTTIGQTQLCLIATCFGQKSAIRPVRTVKRR